MSAMSLVDPHRIFTARPDTEADGLVDGGRRDMGHAKEGGRHLGLSVRGIISGLSVVIGNI
eukprot:12796381-Alexandrium_andersonii.AAC.1